MKPIVIQPGDGSSIAAGAILGLGLWLLYMFVSAIVAADPSVQAATIGGVVALATLVVTVFRERNRSFKEAHREKKIEVYGQFYDIIFEMLGDTGNSAEITKDSPIVKRLMKVAKGALSYGSPKVLLALSELKATANPADKILPIRRAGRVLLAMREDIGLSNAGLDEITIHQVYVSDDLRKLTSQ